MALTLQNREKLKTILVVDDEAGTRGLISTILRQGGYAVLEAADGESAAHIYQRYRGEIDLLLTDVGLPGASGCELAATLRASEPNLQVLFMSGMPQEEEELPLLRKPFGVAELLRRVKTSVENE
jgi:two-component system cell cycle sensor histidine kinase/response regulator CckA